MAGKTDKVILGIDLGGTGMKMIRNDNIRFLRRFTLAGFIFRFQRNRIHALFFIHRGYAFALRAFLVGAPCKGKVCTPDDQ